MSPIKQSRFIDEPQLAGQLEKIGVAPDLLKSYGVWEEFTQGEKTSRLIPVEIKTEFGDFKTSARLSLREVEGELKVIPNFYKPEPALNQSFHGYHFTEEDKQQLIETGNLGKIVPLTLASTGKKTLAFVSVDRLTNEIVALEAKRFKCPKELYGVELTPEQQSRLWAGESIVVRGMKEGTRTFDARVQFNAATRQLDFKVPTRQHLSQDIRRELRIPEKVGEYYLSATEINKLRDGDMIQIKTKDKQGENRNIYLVPDKRNGEVRVYDWGVDLKTSQKTPKVTSPKIKPKKQHQKMRNGN